MGVPGSANFFLAGSVGGYRIERSLRFNSADSAFLSRTPASAGNRRRFTCSAWVKRTGILASLIDVPLLSAGDGTNFGISGTGGLGSTYDGRFYIRNGGANLCRIPNALFRDPSAWYHFVFAVNTEDATAADRQILYVNGVRQENFDGSFAQNTDTNINTTTAHTIGVGLATSANSIYSGNFLLSEYHFIDGQALTPSSFGETDTITGVWKPKKYAGTYGTNGFYLNFSDNSGTTSTTLGKDSSGNGNNWTPNNFSVTAGAGNDSLIDTPTPYTDGGNGRGNYCTLNPLDKNSSQAPKNGNLDFDGSVATGGLDVIAGTMRVTTGKWYWESTITAVGSIAVAAVGVTKIQSIGRSTGGGLGGVSGECAYLPSGNKQIDGSSTAYGSSFTTGDVIGVALDCDAGTVTFYKNNTSQGAITYAVGGGLSPAFGQVQGYGASQTSNFGQRPFAYTPPSGFVALNTQNLPEPSIKKPSSYMDAVTYTGTGSALTPTSSLGFSPDFVWIKSRSAATDHALYDAVRGAEKRLESNNTDVEVTSDGGVTAFNSAGFTLGTLAQVNTNTATYVAWCWDESATPGFDIVTYTGNGVSGRTVAHGLGVSPSLVIVKNRTSGGSYWSTAHTSLSSGYNLLLNNTGAQFIPGNSAYGGISAYSSTTFTVVSGTVSQLNVNTNNDNYVAYLWSGVAGFSKFGSYTGNGSSDGPFVYCGFRPRWVLTKRIDSTSAWYLHDTVRNTYNVANLALSPDLADAEVSANNNLDIVSNGFKLKTTGAWMNASGGTYIFAAFAEAPFKYALAR